MTGERLARWGAALGALALALVVALVAVATELPALRAARWELPWALLLLVAVPAVAWRTTVGADARAPRLRVGTLSLLKDVGGGLRAAFRDVPGVLRSVALVCFTLALARPVEVSVTQSDERSGIDLMVVLDLSKSMEAVIDNLPAELEPLTNRKSRRVLPTRLDAARAVLRDFIRRRESDRVGLVVFAKNTYVASPPTMDYQLLDSLVAELFLGQIASDATAIGDAVGVAVARLRGSTAESRAIILLTDGDSNAGELDPALAAQIAAKERVQVYTVLIGGGAESRVLDSFNMLGAPIYRSRSYPANPELLERIAATTGGRAYLATDATELRESLHDVLDQLTKTRFEAPSATYRELFPTLVVAGALLLLLELLASAFLLRRFP